MICIIASIIVALSERIGNAGVPIYDGADMPQAKLDIMKDFCIYIIREYRNS